VAFLAQNDDLGKAYRRGFDDGIAGSQIKVVAVQTYEPRDATLDSQISQLAASKADVFISTATVPKLQAGALAKLRELGWAPATYITVLTSGLEDVIKPSGVEGFLPNLYSAGFVKNADDPQWAEDPAIAQFLERMKKYSPQANPKVPNGVWGYGTGDTLVHALAGMKSLSRQGLMDSIAALKADVAVLLPGLTVDGSVPGRPPVTGFRLRQLVGGSWKIIHS
jgi:branched-chain amino acid transport system substrate-binding protein